jgi:hypothetical protein
MKRWKAMEIVGGSFIWNLEELKRKLIEKLLAEEEAKYGNRTTCVDNVVLSVLNFAIIMVFVLYDSLKSSDLLKSPNSLQLALEKHQSQPHVSHLPSTHLRPQC